MIELTASFGSPIWFIIFFGTLYYLSTRENGDSFYNKD